MKNWLYFRAVKREQAINAIFELLESRIKEAQKDLKEMDKSMQSDGKSSAGDKFETSREMAQAEWNRIYETFKSAKNQLETMSPLREKKGVVVGVGSLIQMGQLVLFIGPAVGKVKVGNELLMAVSSESPIAKAVLGKKDGEKVIWQGKTTTINIIT